MSAGAKVLRGVFAPIPTPFDLSEKLYLDGLRANLEFWGQSKLQGLVVLGSNGEAPYLTSQEKADILAFVAANRPKDKILLAGTGLETTSETIDLCKLAADLGYDAALVIPPHFYKASMTNAALKAHYEAVADQCPIPVLVYNMPPNTGINLSSDLVISLSFHPNIIGLKDSSGNIVQIAEIVAGAAPGFSVFAGSGSYLLPSLAVGACGATAAVANVFPDETTEIQSRWESGDPERAKQMQHRLLEINKAVTTRWNIPGLKAAMEVRGHYGGPPRRPAIPLGPEDRRELQRIIERTGL